MQFAAAMPVARVAVMLRAHDTRIWRILDHHVAAARACADYSGVRGSAWTRPLPPGAKTVSIFADCDAGFATEGRDKAHCGRLRRDLAAHGGDPTKVTDTSSDMSTAFISGIGEHLPNAAMTFERCAARRSSPARK